jgi:HSP20 family protein
MQINKTQGGVEEELSMMLRRWEPFNELRWMQENVDRLWKDFYGPGGDGAEIEHWAIPLDVMEEGDNIVIHASMPGVDPKNIDVSIENDVLTIKGHTREEREHTEGNYLMRERRSGAFHRSLRLPDTVNTEKAHPYYDHGVLTVTLPKVEGKKARKLTVATGKALEGQK